MFYKISLLFKGFFCKSLYAYLLNLISSTRKMFLLLTPKFGKESDLWVQLGEESVWWKERIFSDVFGKEICGRLSAPVRQRNS
jgi:hypothetical protein